MQRELGPEKVSSGLGAVNADYRPSVKALAIDTSELKKSLDASKSSQQQQSTILTIISQHDDRSEDYDNEEDNGEYDNESEGENDRELDGEIQLAEESRRLIRLNEESLDGIKLREKKNPPGFNLMRQILDESTQAIREVFQLDVTTIETIEEDRKRQL